MNTKNMSNKPTENTLQWKTTESTIPTGAGPLNSPREHSVWEPCPTGIPMGEERHSPGQSHDTKVESPLTSAPLNLYLYWVFSGRVKGRVSIDDISYLGEV